MTCKELKEAITKNNFSESAQDDFIKFTFDCLSTEKNKCRDKYVNSDDMEEEDFNWCYDFVIQHKWSFYSLFAKSLRRNHPEEFNK